MHKKMNERKRSSRRSGREGEPLLSESQIKQVTARIFSDQEASEWVRHQVMISLNQSNANAKIQAKEDRSGESFSSSLGSRIWSEWGCSDDNSSVVANLELQRANEKIAMLESQIHEMGQEISVMKRQTSPQQLQLQEGDTPHSHSDGHGHSHQNRAHTRANTNMYTNTHKPRRRVLAFRNLNYVGIIGAKKTVCNFDDDTFSLMMITDPLSAAWALGLISFFFQITLGVMIAFDQASEGAGSSDFNIPFRVNLVVRVGQFLTIILCLSTQSDVLTSILSFVLLGRNSNWREIVGVYESPSSSSSNKTLASSWSVRIALPNSMKLIQGILVVYISFVIIVQSDDIIDLLKDFTALMILSETDNILFQLAELGFLGRVLQADAVRVKEIEFEDSLDDGIQLVTRPSTPRTPTDSENVFANEEIEIHESSSSSTYAMNNAIGMDGVHRPSNSFPFSIAPRSVKRNKAFYVRCWGLFVLFSFMLGGWIRIMCNQDGGKYFREIYPNCTSSSEAGIDMFALAKTHFGDNKCFGGDLNTLGCKFEGGDCIDFNLAYPLCKGKNMTNVQEKLENGSCDLDMNVPECDFDGGQCCPSYIRHGMSFGDGQCNGGESSTEGCFYDNEDCKAFVLEYPDCPLDKLSRVDGSSDIILGNGVCEGGLYTNDLCGYEFLDCDAGQIGQDVLFRSVSSDSEALDFNLRMSADGSKILIGIHDTDENGTYNSTSPGRVKMYGFDAVTKRWTKSSDLMGDTPDESFAFSIGTNRDGSKVVVGIPNYRSVLGQVKVFHFDPNHNTWAQLGQELKGISFTGHNVAITEDGSSLAISSPHMSTDNAWVSGMVQIFTIDTSQQLWIQIGSDINGDEMENIGYYNVQINALGTRVYFSVGNDSENAAIRVCEYQITKQQWNQLGTDIPNPYPRLFQRPAISGDGNRLAISSYVTETTRHGQVQVFDLDTGTSVAVWNQVGVPIVADADGGRSGGGIDGFGYNIDMSSDGNLLAIGMVRPDCLGNPEWCPTGSVQLYRYSPQNPPNFLFSPVPFKRVGDFDNIMKKAAEQGINNAIFGWDISLSYNGSRIAISGYDFIQGNAFFKVYEVEDVFYPHCVVGDPARIGDGICDDLEPYYTQQCSFDGGDCPLPSPKKFYPDCYVRDPMQVGDGICNDYPPLYTEECGYDGGDCYRWPKSEPVDGFPNCNVWDTSLLGDGKCDDRLPYNGKDCGFDGGDCL